MQITLFDKNGRGKKNLSVKTINSYLESMTRYDDCQEFNNNEFLYQEAVKKVHLSIADGDTLSQEAYYAAVAACLCEMGMPKEEAFLHVRIHTWEEIGEDTLRSVVDAAYADSTDTVIRDEANGVRKNEFALIIFLRQRYVFRYNEVLGYVEYRPNNTSATGFKPLDDRVRNRMVIEARQNGLNVWDNDVKRFIMSDMVESYNPLQVFLERCRGKWDGKDRIRQIADLVPTDNPYWREWFHTWFLAMVNQWSGRRYAQYGNSVAPLLISKQGNNKSTFCKNLLPPELQWGYTDNLQIAEKKQVLQQMSQMLLINLDEFNSISPTLQQGFLKNVIQLAIVKVKRPYGKRVEEFPRLASFIATSNMADVLADPSGCRRFIGIELTGSIDVESEKRIDYEQLYAQALQEISDGAMTYFDKKQTDLIMEQNRQFQLLSPAESYFSDIFAPATGAEDDAEWLSATSLFDEIKRRAGSSLRVTSLHQFAIYLSNIPGMQKKHTCTGTKYLVKRL